MLRRVRGGCMENSQFPNPLKTKHCKDGGGGGSCTTAVH
jgi:hypothetical protein